MGIDHGQLREYVIRPVLEKMGVYTKAGEELLVLTAATESLGGTYIHQVGGGPALGIYQMEPASYWDLWTNYLDYNYWLVERIQQVCPTAGNDDSDTEMIGNLFYATAMARSFYL